MIFGLYAEDLGPKQTLKALKSEPDFVWLSNDGERTNQSWRAVFEAKNIDVLIVGTSRSARGIEAEAVFRRAANSSGLPLVAVEDYPGNYQKIEGGCADLLVVESAAAIALADLKFGDKPTTVISGASMRFDHHDLQPTTISDSKKPPRVLWIGQPETSAAIISLQNIVPKLQTLGVELLFRAHPRDYGYRKGAYSQLFEKHLISIQDVSDLDLTEVLVLSPRLSITHFSSLAVELGFKGVPSLYVLYPNAGRKILRDHVGYSTPLVCKCGGGFVLTEVKDTLATLKRAIFDENSRSSVNSRFCKYFQVGENHANAVKKKILNYLREG